MGGLLPPGQVLEATPPPGGSWAITQAPALPRRPLSVPTECQDRVPLRKHEPTLIRPPPPRPPRGGGGGGYPPRPPRPSRGGGGGGWLELIRLPHHGRRRRWGVLVDIFLWGGSRGQVGCRYCPDSSGTQMEPCFGLRRIASADDVHEVCMQPKSRLPLCVDRFKFNHSLHTPLFDL